MNGKVLATCTLLLVVGLAWGISPAKPSPEPKMGSSVLAGDMIVRINRDVAVQKQLQNALLDKGATYQPRTRHFNAQGRPLYTNRLILEDSPYLLQHAHNPVDWYAWGPEAFARAKNENKPIFLSIGYSTCHWCHVMEKESFENPQIAALLNENFVSIKVDRERRPDVDATYMTAVTLISGQGGWPMSSFLSPEGKTFFGGTYYPPEEFTQLIQRINLLWREDQAEFLAQADNVAEAVAELSMTRAKAQELGVETVKRGVISIMSAYDDLQGGYGQAPKFPNEPLLFLLLNHVEHGVDKYVLNSLEHTLDTMAHGGIYDQIGGGFHRYSTDNRWRVPHFEKMLYNQANLSRIYLRGWKLTSKPAFARVARQMLDYVLREMTAPEGGFYSATDADSEGEEGRFFMWTQAQIKTALNQDDARLAIDLYEMSAEGDAGIDGQGRNILHMGQSMEDYAVSHQLEPNSFIDHVAQINQHLLKTRQQRIPPSLDTKIITAWNGMMITAFALAGDTLNQADYLAAAIRAAEFIWSHNRNNDGDLWRASLNGHASVAASQEDYAYLAESFVMLYDVTGEKIWLQRTEQLVEKMLAQFWDKADGGFFMGSEQFGLGHSGIGQAGLAQARLKGMGRVKDSSEGAIPSGNSVALQVLQKLSRRTNNMEYKKYAEASLSAFSATLTSNPTTFPYMLSAANDLYKGETGAHQYAARGAVKVNAEINAQHSLTLNLSIQPGWHINAHQPLQEYLIPTSLQLPGDSQGWRMEDVNYPQEKRRTLGFQQEQLALYEGQFQVKAKLTKSPAKKEQALNAQSPPPVELHLQACSDSVCLAPETLRLRPLMR